jgi:hypothetical protein
MDALPSEPFSFFCFLKRAQAVLADIVNALLQVFIPSDHLIDMVVAQSCVTSRATSTLAQRR